MALFTRLFLSTALNAFLLSRPVAALAFKPTPAVLKASQLGIQADFEPTAISQAKNDVLELRQNSQNAPLATCGWVAGNTANPVTCGASLYCATTSTFIGCCEPSSCIGIFTTCYDMLGVACNVACQNNPQNLICPTVQPYCALYNYEHGSVGYGCAAYSGYTSTVLLNPITTGIGKLTGINSSPISSSHTMLATSTTSPTTAKPSSSGSSGLASGPTAGIAVGSVVVVAAICFSIYLFCSRKRKTSQPARQSYIGSTTTSSTVHPSGDYSGKYVFPSPQSPPWEWTSTDHHNPAPVEMPVESRNTHELHAVPRYSSYTGSER